MTTRRSSPSWPRRRREKREELEKYLYRPRLRRVDTVVPRGPDTDG
jgi:hypothetical protein